MTRLLKHLDDVLIVGGAGALAYGAALIYLPAGFIVGGLLAVAGGIVLARSRG